MVLVYLHAVFSKRPTTCLVDVENSWPRDGILRVEIIPDAPENYTLTDSYQREYGPFDQYAYEQELWYNMTTTNINSTDAVNVTEYVNGIHTEPGITPAENGSLSQVTTCVHS